MKFKSSLFFYIIMFVTAGFGVLTSVLYHLNDGKYSIFFVVLSVLVTLAVAGFFVWYMIDSRKYILKLNRNISVTEKNSLYEFPIGVVIIDSENVVVWSNKYFDDRIIDPSRSYGVHIDKLIPIDLNKVLSSKGSVVSFNDKYYRAIALRPNDGELELTMISFQDITDYIELEVEHRMSRPSVMMFMIDSYDELMNNVKASDKAAVLVAIEELFENFMSQNNGIIRKLNNDKYIVILEERHLRKVIKDKFEILDKAREILVGDNKLPVTLSIGVGHTANTLIESERYANQALDMCLGRGGDQCAVKTENGFEFFGGVSKGIEKHTKVKARIIAAALRELVNTKENVLVMGHSYGDFDSIGASIGLVSAIRSMGKNASVVVDKEKNMAKQLISHISENSGEGFFIEPSEALSIVNDRTLLIIVDTHNPLILESPELYRSVKSTVVIDHHRKMVNHIDDAVIFYHEPYASSACEMVSELIQYLGDGCKISAKDAEALLAGISLDTKHFAMRTGVRTFEAAAFLRRLGADMIAVKGFFSNNIEVYQQRCTLVASAEIYRECAIAHSKSVFSEIRLAASQAADELLGIEGVKASFVMYESDGCVNISARSLGDFNVQVVMEAMGGGGHQTMAGTKLSTTFSNAYEQLVKAIDDYLA